MQQDLLNDKLSVWDSWMRKAEGAVAVLLAFATVILHYVNFRNAGALWRDEVNSVNMASMSSLAETWRNTAHDSHPMFFSLILKVWMGLGMQSDLQLRVLGLCFGLGVLAIIWLAVRQFGLKVPILSLLLFAFCPLSIIYTDSVRPYGLGILLLFAMYILIWRVATRPSPLSFASAAVVVVLSVQTLHQNALFMASFVLAGIAVAIVNRSWRTVLLLAAIPIIAAMSVLPCLPLIRSNVRDWGYCEISPDVNLAVILRCVVEAVSFSGWYWVPVWFVLLALVAAGALRRLTAHPADVSRGKPGARVFCATAMVTSIVIVVGFFSSLHHATSPWYYLLLMAVSAICLDVLLASDALWNRYVVPIAAFVAIATFIPSLQHCRASHTNVNMLAAKISASADKGDLIVIDPWYLAITFQRYYNGPAPVVTIPPIEDHRIHRFDLVKAQMMAPDPIGPVLEQASETLRRGHSIWLIQRDPSPNEPLVRQLAATCGAGIGTWVAFPVPLDLPPVPPTPPPLDVDHPEVMPARIYTDNWSIRLMHSLCMGDVTTTIMAPNTEMLPSFENCYIIRINALE